MISFDKITPKGFAEYSEYFIADYSEEIADNYGYTREKAMSQAKQELEEAFPNGVALPDNHLVSIQLNANGQASTIGYLWYSLGENSDHAFICDFYIGERDRGKGYGKAALSVLEEVLQQSGIDQIRLRVAYKNPRALKLYKEIGFEETGTNMIKRFNST